MALGEGQLLGYPECGTSRQDGDLGHGVRVLGEHGDKGMTGFVHSDGVFLFGQKRVRVVSPADQEPVSSGAEVFCGEDFASVPHCVDGRFIDEVGEVGPREPGRAARHGLQVDVSA